jgi:hypothetical protein
MPMLGALLGGFFTGFITFLASWIGKKAALAVAVVAVFVALLVALWAAITALVSGLVVATPTGGAFEYFWMGFFLLMPSNWSAVLAACLSADVAVFLYRFNVNRIANPVAGG